MADFSAPCPVETERRGNYLHDRANRPSVPLPLGKAVLARFWEPSMAFALALGAVALAFQTRASWESHRDWVVPVTVPLFVLAGTALGYLLARAQMWAILPAAGPLAVTLTLTGLNIWRGAVTDGQDGLRDAMSIVAGVFLGLTALAALAGLIWVEWRSPTRPPSSED